jgi:hypothetical protein
VRDRIFEAYGGGRQKEKRRDIENYLGDGLDFVTHIRNRILAYVAFGKELQKYLAEQRAAHTALKEGLDALTVLASQIDERVEPRMRALLGHKSVKEIAARLCERHEAVTPPALVAQLNRDFLARGLIDYDGPD